MKTTSYLEFLQERNLLSRSLLLSISEEILSTLLEHFTSFYSLKLPNLEGLKERYQEGFLAAIIVPKEILSEIISEKDKDLGNKVGRNLLFIFSDEKTKTLKEREHFNTQFNSIRLFSKNNDKHSLISSLKKNEELLLHELGHFFQTLKKPDSNSLPSAMAHYSDYNKYGKDAHSLSYFFDDEELDAELFKLEKKLKAKEGKPTYREFLSSLLDDPYFSKFKEIISYLLDPESKPASWKKLFRKMAYKIDKVFKFSFSEKKKPRK